MALNSANTLSGIRIIRRRVVDVNCDIGQRSIGFTMSGTVNTSKKDKERQAQLARLEALKHLETQGQSLKGYASLAAEMGQNEAKKDNTLEVMRRQKVAALGAKAAPQRGVDVTETLNVDLRQTTKATPAAAIDTNALSGTDATRSANELPAGWRAVKDAASGREYFWNTESNLTTWTRPSAPPGTTVASNRTAPSSSGAAGLVAARVTATGGASYSAAAAVAALPAGWEEKLHAATQQMIYVHSETGEKTFVRPTATSTTTEADIVPPEVNRAPVRSGAGGLSQQTGKKRVIHDVLDPAAVNSSNNNV